MSADSYFQLESPGPARSDFALLLLPAAWALLLAVVFAAPRLLPSADPGDDLTRNTVRVALLFWFPAVSIMLGLDDAGRRTATTAGKAARLCWMLAWLAYLVHLATAMHYYHGWSHADAMQHVEQVSGFGPGIFFSHLFTLLWTADVGWWWLDRDAYARRLAWVDRALHTYMVFIIFNGTVVYETGVIRWAGAVMFAVLGVGLVSRLLTPRGRIA
jgi:hypothetical protein